MYTYRDSPAVFNFLTRSLRRIPLDNPGTPVLPDELLGIIVNGIVDGPAPPLRLFWVQPWQIGPHPAETPPPNGASPLMKLPTELRRAIFAESLPARDVEYHPMCEDDVATMRQKKAKKDAAKSSSKDRPKPKANRISDLMTLNKTLCDETTEVMYEERLFVIHVHEGLQRGGIELQQVGRQPLQYKDSEDDQRFWKFTNLDEFGFRRLKKIKIQIHPPATTEKDPRHTAINTYFMNLALCRLLERSGEKQNRITSLSIEFAKPKASHDQGGRASIIRAEQYWWDLDRQQPRETSIYNLPNIELVLRPFATLTGCHCVSISLPGDSIASHAPTAAFVEKLTWSMMSKDGTLFADDNLEHKVETARAAMEEYVNYTLHGTGYHKVPKMTEDEMMEDDHTPTGDDSSDSDGKEREDGHKTGQKHGLSPPDRTNIWRSKFRMSDDSKYSEKEHEILHMSLREEEERQLRQVIEMSLKEAGIQAPVPDLRGYLSRSALHDTEADRSSMGASDAIRESASRRLMPPPPPPLFNDYNTSMEHNTLVDTDSTYIGPENTTDTSRVYQQAQPQRAFDPSSLNLYSSQLRFSPDHSTCMQTQQSPLYLPNTLPQQFSMPAWRFGSGVLPSFDTLAGSNACSEAQPSAHAVIGRIAEDTFALDPALFSDSEGATDMAQLPSTTTSMAGSPPQPARSSLDLTGNHP